MTTTNTTPETITAEMLEAFAELLDPTDNNYEAQLKSIYSDDNVEFL